MAQLTRVWAEQAATVSGPSSPSSISKRAPSDKPLSTATAAQTETVAHAAEQTVDAHAPSSVEALKSAARQIETYLKSTGRQLEFRVDEDTGRTVVSVRDAQTGDLIRQIPSEEALRLARALGTQSNVLVDLLA